ncbi:MAG: AsmA family protein [Gammaproteobacteria bacterium]|nr:AsmA family protein [Gammaproteobacteria bacterium]
MPRALKFLLIAVIAVCILTAAGIGMFLLQFDASRYREDLTALVEQQTGREFSIQGDIYLAASLLPTLAVEQATLGNADWAREPVMLSVGRLETQIALLPLLHGEIAIRRIILLQPVVNLEIGEAGAGNWLFSAAGDDDGTQEPDRGEGLPAIDIRELQIEEATITYLGAGQDQPTVFRIDHLSAAPEGLGESLQVELTATFEDLPVSLSGTTGSLAQFTAGTPYPLSLAAKAGAAEGSIEGRIENPVGNDGN